MGGAMTFLLTIPTLTTKQYSKYKESTYMSESKQRSEQNEVIMSCVSLPPNPALIHFPVCY